MTRALAIVVSALDIVIFIAALVLVFGSEEISVIVTGDLLACVACLLAVPVMHYWIEGRP